MTMQFAVFTIQLKAGLSVMVKAPDTPGIGVVTQLAILPQLTFMLVILLMAIVTLSIDALVLVIQVALFAA